MDANERQNLRHENRKFPTDSQRCVCGDPVRLCRLWRRSNVLRQRLQSRPCSEAEKIEGQLLTQACATPAHAWDPEEWGPDCDSDGHSKLMSGARAVACLFRNSHRGAGKLPVKKKIVRRCVGCEQSPRLVKRNLVAQILPKSKMLPHSSSMKKYLPGTFPPTTRCTVQAEFPSAFSTLSTRGDAPR